MHGYLSLMLCHVSVGLWMFTQARGGQLHTHTHTHTQRGCLLWDEYAGERKLRIEQHEGGWIMQPGQ